jgi:hypothetical protein
MDFEAGTIAYGVDGRTVGVLELDPLHTLRSTMLWTAALELVCIDEPEVLDRSRYAAFFDNQLILALPGEAAR